MLKETIQNTKSYLLERFQRILCSKLDVGSLPLTINSQIDLSSHLFNVSLSSSWSSLPRLCSRRRFSALNFDKTIFDWLKKKCKLDLNLIVPHVCEFNYPYCLSIYLPFNCYIFHEAPSTSEQTRQILISL